MQFQKNIQPKKTVGVTTHHSVGLLTCLRPCHHIVIINVNRNKLMYVTFGRLAVIDFRLLACARLCRLTLLIYCGCYI